MLHMPSPMLLNPSGGAYSRWAEHVDAQISTQVMWGGNVPFSYNGPFKVTASALIGNMYGTSWQGSFSRSYTTVARAIQHGLPDAATVNAVVALGGRLILSQSWLGYAEDFFGLNRNGYESATVFGTPDNQVQLGEISWFDPLQSIPMTIDPTAGGPAQPYTKRGWTNS